MPPSKPRGQKVPALKIVAIRVAAGALRQALGCKEPKVDVIDILENKLGPAGLIWDVRDREEMGSDHAITYPEQNTMLIREDVYEGACNGVGRDRFTFGHEFGHLFLHQGVTSFARSEGAATHRVFEDSEWQADTFSAELLMPVEFIQRCCQSVEDIRNMFGVSGEAAQLRARKLREKGLIDWS